MALFPLIAGSLLLATWMAIGLLPWLATSVLTRGHAGLVYLPVCMFLGVTGGLLVPFIGLTGWSGVWLSLLAALLLPATLMVARGISLGALESERRRVRAHVSTGPE